MKLHEKPLMLAALILTALALYALPARCAESSNLAEVVHVSAGVNGAWLDGPGAAFPADLEAGGTAWASLSPHISAFADAYYGFSHSYLRWDGGAKITATDVDNQNFSVYLALKYQGGSVRALHPNEAAYGAGFGWQPNLSAWPNIALGADASIGAKTDRTIAYIAVRYLLPLK